MRLDLNASRSEYFASPTDTHILREYIEKDEGNITIVDLAALDAQGKVEVATAAASLEALMKDLQEGRQIELDHHRLVGLLAQGSDALLVLPPNYVINTGDARDIIAYRKGNPILLDAMSVKERLVEGSIPKTRALSAVRKIGAKWTPERVLPTAFELAADRAGSLDTLPLTYAWWGKDNHRRIVSLYRALQGAELRAFQNLAALKIVPPRIRKELRTNRHWRHHGPLSPAQRDRREGKLRRMEYRIRKYDLRAVLDRLDVTEKDLIEPTKREGHFNTWTGWHLNVPSLSRPSDPYLVTLTSVPVFPAGDVRRIYVPWELDSDVGGHADKAYRSHRRSGRPERGNRDSFFTHTEIAPLNSVRNIVREEHDLSMGAVPIVSPREPIIATADRLRYGTIALTYDPATKRFSRTALNHTTIERILMLQTLASGVESFHSNWVVDADTFRREKIDIDRHLVRVRY